MLNALYFAINEIIIIIILENEIMLNALYFIINEIIIMKREYIL